MKPTKEEHHIFLDILATPVIHLQALTYSLVLSLAERLKQDPVVLYHQLLAESERIARQLEERVPTQPEGTIAI